MNAILEMTLGTCWGGIKLELNELAQARLDSSQNTGLKIFMVEHMALLESKEINLYII